MTKSSLLVTSGMANGRINYRFFSSPAHTETLVLVMGYSGSLGSWDQDFIQDLAAFANVLVFDNRGTGHSFHPEDPKDFSVKAMASDLHDLVAHLGLRHFHLLGYSLGGCAALAYAEVWGDNLASLLLMSTTAGGANYVAPQPELLQRLMAPVGDSVFEKSLSLWRQCLSEPAIARLMDRLRRIHEAQSVKMTPLRTFVGQMAAFRAFQFSPAQPLAVEHVAVISGVNDRLMPHGNSLALKRLLAGASLFEIQGCEHMPYLEKPETLVGIVNDWLLARMTHR